MNSKILISRQKIQEKIDKLAQQIAKDYMGKDPVIVGILDGTFIFLADLSRALWNAGLRECQVYFIGVSSYGTTTQSSKRPKLTKDIPVDVSNRNVLIVEDIADTGYTLDYVQKLLKKRNPTSLKTLVLLSKPARREIEVSLDYIGFEILNKWVTGYGFDIDSRGRGEPDIMEKTD